MGYLINANEFRSTIKIIFQREQSFYICLGLHSVLRCAYVFKHFLVHCCSLCLFSSFAASPWKSAPSKFEFKTGRSTTTKGPRKTRTTSPPTSTLRPQDDEQPLLERPVRDPSSEGRPHGAGGELVGVQGQEPLFHQGPQDQAKRECNKDTSLLVCFIRVLSSRSASSV